MSVVVSMADFEESGFRVLRGLWGGEAMAHAASAVESAVASGTTAPRLGRSGAVRGLEQVWPEALELLEHPVLDAAISEILGQGAHVLRSVLFDKPPGRSWVVPWHRDVVFPGAEGARTRLTTARLRRMLVVRVHLGAAHGNTGALRVLPGSHRVEPLDARPCTPISLDAGTLVPAEPGDVLLMSPLLLHRSSRNRSEVRGRPVLHFDLVGDHHFRAAAFADGVGRR